MELRNSHVTTPNPCVQGANKTPRLPPVDEAPSRPEFLQYRARLQAAVERQDIEAVIAEVDPGIRLGFDASGGVDAFRKLFGERSESWEELRVVLSQGGSFSTPTSFEAPYVYSDWPDRFDSFECAAVTGRNVRLRSAPRLDAPIITTISYSIVQLMDQDAVTTCGRTSGSVTVVQATSGTPTCGVRWTIVRCSI